MTVFCGAGRRHPTQASIAGVVHPTSLTGLRSIGSWITNSGIILQPASAPKVRGTPVVKSLSLLVAIAPLSPIHGFRAGEF